MKDQALLFLIKTFLPSNVIPESFYLSHISKQSPFHIILWDIPQSLQINNAIFIAPSRREFIALYRLFHPICVSSQNGVILTEQLKASFDLEIKKKQFITKPVEQKFSFMLRIFLLGWFIRYGTACRYRGTTFYRDVELWPTSSLFCPEYKFCSHLVRF